ncbi:MAG: protein-L-isoaspartate(D-aspartate) O-methyltransferase [Alphaproteobacteria bacterium]|nr:protein-L-isoaspartate(D-aspartate) O-methyltransferase [Alphaproteobacteria bacterium]
MTQAARKIRLVLELRRAGVTDTRVLSAIERVPREIFVPEAFQDQAYENTALPIDCSQTISQPLIVGLMTQMLEPDKKMRVLEIGTGSGYQTAVLCRLFRRVYTIERHRELLKQAEARLAELKCHNVTAQCADGTRGWPEQAPFPRILVTAAAPEMPATLVDQLDEGGIMIVPIGASVSDQWIYKVTRGRGGFKEERMSQVRFVPLVSGEAPAVS